MLRTPHRRLPPALRITGQVAFALASLALPHTLHAQDAAAPATETKAPPTISAKQSREADDAYLAGARELTHNNPAAAERNFGRALALDPSKPEYALSLAVAKEHHVTELIQQAAKARLLGHNDQADRLFAEARTLDPDNLIVTQHLDEGPLPVADTPGFSAARDEIAKLSGPIHLKPTAGLQSFHSRGDVQSTLRDVYKAFGIRTSFDTSVTGPPIRFDLENVDFETATRILLQMTHVFATPLEEHSVLLAKDTQENRDRLVPQVEETFFLPGLSTEQITELSNIAKNIFDLKKVSVEGGANSLIMSGNEDAMKLVNVTFAEMLDGGADILLEVHLYEVDKTHTQNIGAQLPTSAGIFSIAAEAQSIVTANQSILQQAIAAGLLTLSGSPLNQLEQELGFLIASGAVSLPQVSGLLGIFGNGLTLAGLFLGSSSTFNLLLNSTDTHMLDAVQMRVGDNKDATFRSGTRYPITTSTYSSAVPSSLSSALSGVKINGTSASALLSQFLGSGSTATVPQIQYEDLGVTLKATPQALKSGQVRVKLDLKIEALAGGSLNGIPVLNNRQLISDVTVPNGQTALLATEVSSLEMHSIDGLPGLSEIPGFQGTEKASEKDTGELLITITPHIVRKRSTMIASRRLLANIGGVEQ